MPSNYLRNMTQESKYSLQTLLKYLPAKYGSLFTFPIMQLISLLGIFQWGKIIFLLISEIQAQRTGSVLV